MLIQYRNDYEKIAMGLLSFIPELKDLNHLKMEMKWFTQSDQRSMYLWRNEAEHFIGIVCLEVGVNFVLVRRLSFTPTERTGRNIFGLLTSIHHLYPDKKLLGTMATQPVITNWGKTLHG
ncbi:hypothetical protein [Paucilactobacillus wasatchensis]|uniref:Riboflavin biosynthesis acetyltransferase RibT n=1 Tax=Paucilactobacillus wasatchensis TaxID=1335616 RepID=A0A0D1A8B9_9LACO|nr:hypothetical protein [Paucilactobacillus wasatchensis]KIS03026.1 riboflavin biosynthesis acetyltransferase RibT [Paucilactobacillus wasatchensis]